MLVYVGHIELPVCGWMGEGNNCESYTPEMRTYNIASIERIGLIPTNNVFPPAGDDRCWIDAGEGGPRTYCFLSYEEVCKRVNAKVREVVNGAAQEDEGGE